MSDSDSGSGSNGSTITIDEENYLDIESRYYSYTTSPKQEYLGKSVAKLLKTVELLSEINKKQNERIANLEKVVEDLKYKLNSQRY